MIYKIKVLCVNIIVTNKLDPWQNNLKYNINGGPKFVLRARICMYYDWLIMESPHIEMEKSVWPI